MSISSNMSGAAKYYFDGAVRIIICAGQNMMMTDVSERILQELEGRGTGGCDWTPSMYGVQPKPLPHDDGSNVYNQNRRPV